MTSEIGSAHQRAMELADEGLHLRRAGEHEAALPKFRDAFELESKAAELISKDLQPGHGVLHRSAATLALDANQIDEAMRLIEEGLDAAPIPSVREELEELRRLAQPHDIKWRLARDPAVVLQHTLDTLAVVLDEMIGEIGHTGRKLGHAIQLASWPEVLVYRSPDEFAAWKDLSVTRVPPRWRVSIVPGQNQGEWRLSTESFGLIDERVEATLRSIVSEREAFDYHADSQQTGKAA